MLVVVFFLIVIVNICEFSECIHHHLNSVFLAMITFLHVVVVGYFDFVFIVHQMFLLHAIIELFVPLFIA